jgi:soluble lytic murein transglycosylase-like protein
MDRMSAWKELIIRSAESFRLDANLIEAVIMVESSGNPNAVRFEPLWRYFNHPSVWAEKLGISRAEEEMLQATSFGLMQVMGGTARDLGFTDDLNMLKNPEIGVFYGCKKLSQLQKKYEQEDQVISAYNQGNARMRNGMFVNQRYVDKVYTILRAARVLA